MHLHCSLDGHRPFSSMGNGSSDRGKLLGYMYIKSAPFFLFIRRKAILCNFTGTITDCMQVLKMGMKPHCNVGPQLSCASVRTLYWCTLSHRLSGIELEVHTSIPTKILENFTFPPWHSFIRGEIVLISSLLLRVVCTGAGYQETA